MAKFLYPIKDRDSIVIKRTQGTDINGALNIVEELATYGTFISKSKTVFTKDGRQITLSGTVFKKGDIFSNVEDVEGIILYGGKQLNIITFNRIKDIYGNVHHVEVEVA